MVIAARRMAGTVLARASSVSGIRAAARKLCDDASCGDETGDCGNGSGVEDGEGREGGRAATEAVEEGAVALVSEVAEVRLFECVVFL